MSENKPFLSIIIACWNEPENLAGTIRSIEETAVGLPIEIIAIDDGGRVPFDWDSLHKLSDRLTVIHNPVRLGHSACRQAASARAGEWMLFTDAHMVFEPSWFEAFEIQSRINDSRTLFCGPFISSTIEWEKSGHPPNIFWGARLYYWQRNGDALDVLSYEPIARPPSHVDRDWSFEVPCVIGANYFIRRDWFDIIDGLNNFVGWTAMDEFMLSLKTWLFGGSVRLIPDVRLRHVLHDVVRNMPRTQLLFNKLSAAYQIFPSHIYQSFLTALPTRDDPKVFSDALQMVAERRESLEQARFYFSRNIRRNHDWLCSKFDLLHPLDIGAAQYICAAASPAPSPS
jgi:glycosyltransferase involved in cell wall biosynthesis